MLVRFALVGLAVAGLASPVGAMEATPDTAQAQNEGASLDIVAPTRTHHRSRSRSRSRHAARATTVAEPTDVAAAQAPEAGLAEGGLAAGGLAEETAEAPKPKKVHPRKPRIALVMPPLRPTDLTPAVVESASPAPAEPAQQSVAAAAPPPAAPAPAAKTPTFVNIMPPLRPSFPSEPAAAVETAKAGETTPSATVPDGVGAPTAKFVIVTPPARPAFAWDVDTGAALPGEVAAANSAQPPASPAPQQPGLLATLFGPSAATASQPSFIATPDFDTGPTHRGSLDALVSKHARLNGVPVALVQRVVMRESRYNPRAVGHGGALGLMQIKHATARALGYTGPASGLLDAETNLTYAVKYLAGAYRTAGGDFTRAVSYYARGYYYAAKNAGTLLLADRRHPRLEAEARTDDVAAQ